MTGPICRVPDTADQSPSPATIGPLPFQCLGHYQILERIGGGGMGDVYRGYDPPLDRYVAIKVLRAELASDEDYVRRFHAEAGAVARLDHPNIVPMYFSGEDGGRHFFAMQFIDGEPLSHRIGRCGSVPLEEALAIAADCLAALGAAHVLGLVHRDVRPGNILLDRRTGHAVLCEFGLVRSQDASQRPTATRAVLGSVEYIAPEQVRGQDIDGRADIYALGVVLYRMLAGRPPFTADTPTAMIFQHAYGEPPPLGETAADLPAPALALVARMIAQDPARRCQSCAEALADLNEVQQAFGRREAASTGSLAVPRSAESDAEFEVPAGMTELTLRGPRGHRLRRAMLAAAAGCLAVVATVLFLKLRHAQIEPPATDSIVGSIPSELLLGCTWVWYPEGFPEVEAPLGIRYFRKQFAIPTDRKMRMARFVLAADDEFTLYVNDQQAAESDRRGDNWHRINVIEMSGRLTPGVNQLAILAENTAGPAGLVGRLHVEFEEGEPLSVPIDATWKTANRQQPDWTAATFDDRNWPSAKELVPFGGGSWGWLDAPPPREPGPAGREIPPGQWIDLLPLVDLGECRLEGGWRQDGQSLTAEAPQVANLTLPAWVSGSYDLEIDSTLSAGSGAWKIVLPVGEAHCGVTFNSYRQNIDGIEMIDGEEAINNATQTPASVMNGQKCTVLVRVRTSSEMASIEVLRDGKPHLHWQGSPASLSLGSDVGWHGGDPRQLGLSVWFSTMKFDRVRLRPLSGKASLVRPGQTPPPRFALARETADRAGGPVGARAACRATPCEANGLGARTACSRHKRHIAACKYPSRPPRNTT